MSETANAPLPAAPAVEAPKVLLTQFISPALLTTADRIIHRSAHGKVTAQTLTSVVHSPRGCLGRTHVQIRNGMLCCFDQCSPVEVERPNV